MNKNYTDIRRWLFLLVGLFIIAMGVGLSIKGNLGTSPISSLPYVASLISGLTVGQTTIILHCVLILLQIIILRKKYDYMQLLQLPIVFFFGFMTDLALKILNSVVAESYGMQWIFCATGIILVAIGVSCEVTAAIVTLAGEGFVLAVCKILPIKFGIMKVRFDVSLVVISCVLSVLFLHSIVGVREGTVVAALLVGLLAKQINKPFGKLAKHLFKDL